MIQLQQNRYLWVHFAALALVPLLLDICLLGFTAARAAFGYPSAYGLQFWFVVIVCVVPPLWMQIARPFYVFALPPIALKPDMLTEEQKRCLTVLTSWQIKALAGLTAFASIWLLAQLYEKAAIVATQSVPLMTPAAGFIAAVNAFFFACLFMQIGVSAGRSLLISPTALKRVSPYEGSIADNFLIAGIRVKKLLVDTSAPQTVVSNGASAREAGSEEADPEEADPEEADLEEAGSENDISSEDVKSKERDFDRGVKNGGE